MDESQLAVSTAVELAVMSAGPIGNDPAVWKRRVLAAVGDIAAMLRAESDACKIAGKVIASTVFVAKFVAVEDEYGKDRETGESMRRPTRAILVTQSDRAIKIAPGKPTHNPEGIERTRTEPLWTAEGRAMRARLQSLEPGTTVAVYKHNEVIDADTKVRVLAHVEVLSRPLRDSATVEQQQADTPAAAPAATSPTPDAQVAEPRAGGGGHPAIAERFERLNNRQKVAFGRACSGIESFMSPSDENLDRVLVVLGKIERGEPPT